MYSYLTRFKNVTFHAKIFLRTTTRGPKGPPPRCLPQGPHHPRSTPVYVNNSIHVYNELMYCLSYCMLICVDDVVFFPFNVYHKVYTIQYKCRPTSSVCAKTFYQCISTIIDLKSVN